MSAVPYTSGFLYFNRRACLSVLFCDYLTLRYFLHVSCLVNYTQILFQHYSEYLSYLNLIPFDQVISELADHIDEKCNFLILPWFGI